MRILGNLIWFLPILLAGGLISCNQPHSVLIIVGGHDIDLPITIIDHSHPVTAGLEDFIIHDEGYSNIQICEKIHPLFGASHPDCAPLVGWIRQSNRSTCMYLMFGHDKQAYNNETLQQILNNSIHWLVKQQLQ